MTLRMRSDAKVFGQVNTDARPNRRPFPAMIGWFVLASLSFFEALVTRRGKAYIGLCIASGLLGIAAEIRILVRYYNESHKL